MSLIDQAEEHIRAGRPAQAVTLAQAYLQERPDDPRGLSCLVRAAGRAAAWTTAESAARRLAELEPQDARHWYVLGVALRKLRRFDEARQAQGRALALAPTFDEARTELQKIERDRRGTAVQPPLAQNEWAAARKTQLAGELQERVAREDGPFPAVQPAPARAKAASTKPPGPGPKAALALAAPDVLEVDFGPEKRRPNFLAIAAVVGAGASLVLAMLLVHALLSPHRESPSAPATSSAPSVASASAAPVPPATSSAPPVASASSVPAPPVASSAPPVASASSVTVPPAQSSGYQLSAAPVAPVPAAASSAPPMFRSAPSLRPAPTVALSNGSDSSESVIFCFYGPGYAGYPALLPKRVVTIPPGQTEELTMARGEYYVEDEPISEGGIAGRLRTGVAIFEQYTQYSYTSHIGYVDPDEPIDPLHLGDPQGP